VAINATGNALGNVLTGNAAANVLDGGLGLDKMTGGAGLDTFRLSTALTANVDTITDFSVVDDTIQLENAIFTQFAATGTLNVANFVKASAAVDVDDYVIYNPASGALLYDADGFGAGVAVQIAALGVNLALTNADFTVI
jgi:Ca2+-binding RTX toxin-like protein